MDGLRHSKLVSSWRFVSMYIYTCMYHVVLDEIIRFVTEKCERFFFFVVKWVRNSLFFFHLYICCI